MEFYCLCVVRKVGSPFALSNVIYEMANCFSNLKTVKLHGNTIIYPGNYMPAGL